ncbi:MAG: hypothetical protein WCV80_02975 [Candidatus Paceibacterota bacterium]|jgi:hypothetical protein
MSKNINSIKKNDGQAMILSVMMLGGVLISIGVIAGILVLYQIRQVNDVENSAKAFFAADAGVEWMTYGIYVASTTSPVFTNDASFISTSTIANGNVFIKVQGFAGDAVRALDSEFVAPLSIEYFRASPATVAVGGTTDLSWNSINASHCALIENGITIDPDISLSSTGKEVSPPGVIGDSVLYTLTCSEVSGASVTSDITVTIGNI